VTRVTLASASASRAAILRAAGVDFRAVAAGVDEAAVKAQMLGAGAGANEIAEELAKRKALHVSRDRGGLVIGADQTLEFEGAVYDKPEDEARAREQLERLRGRTHSLHAAVAVARDGEILWAQSDTARLTMRAFSDRFLNAYLERQGEALLATVGAYRLEGEGVQLFEAIDGDYFSILGLPLMGLLKILRREGALEL
jgi:septum formation protein